MATAAAAIYKMHALVIDDEAAVRGFLVEVLRGDGWQVSEADTAECAFERLSQGRWSLVFCDVMLGGVDGYAVLKRFGLEQPEAQVVLMTGHGSAAGALDATACGAYDYLLKPFKVSEVQGLSRAIKRRRLKTPAPASNGGATAPVYTSDIHLIGHSAAFMEAMKLVGRVAPTNLPVFISGESGTGKELVARAIHHRSRRAAKAFVPVNCGAIPSELIEAELFGHVRGSFTGAERDRHGLFEEADGGTLFLDEITETSSAFQVKLLRVLQKGEVRRVGSNDTLEVDVRVLAATNRELEAEVKEGRFRQDLFYRLSTVSLELPPLRERVEDVLPLVQHFATLARAGGTHDLRFSREAVRLLHAYQWPGNIRELENAVIRAAALCDQIVRPEDLPERIRQYSDAPREKVAWHNEAISEQSTECWLTLAELEGLYVTRVLSHTGGNIQAAARLLRVDRKTVDRMIKRHQIHRKRTTQDSQR